VTRTKRLRAPAASIFLRARSSAGRKTRRSRPRSRFARENRDRIRGYGTWEGEYIFGTMIVKWTGGFLGPHGDAQQVELSSGVVG